MEAPKIELDSKIVTRLKHKIVLAESTNLRTKTKSEPDMIKYLKKMIEEEIECWSGQ